MADPNSISGGQIKTDGGNRIPPRDDNNIVNNRNEGIQQPTTQQLAQHQTQLQQQVIELRQQLENERQRHNNEMTEAGAAYAQLKTNLDAIKPNTKELKIPEPEKFRGTKDKQSVRDWLDNVKEIFAIAGVPLNQPAVIHAAAYLTDEAKIWYRMHKDCFMSWQWFETATGYYRKFILNYSKVAAPLTELLKDEQRFKWGEEQQSA